ncbi:DUF2634 domain-containing protein [Acetobacterium wieringae]|uniref:DUF2634 domain-containing protein n=1 Tax=Acetobacterium wieringae TaxID=52694 RepID=UPI002033D9D1|nr:DUF2634 domain-containing protein [Acetobacterium wieringae]URN83964.1 DUF2634 domain-containing protein [Acetobacterium wieringae]
MLPEYNNAVTIDTEVLPSKTFSIDENAGMIDNLEAVKQAVDIILDVNRFESPILPWSFGNEMRNLIGEPMDFAAIESERYIKEALKQDDRITDVVDFEFTENGGALLASYRVVTIYGDFTRETEVSL